MPYILASSTASQWDHEDAGVRVQLVQRARHITGLRRASCGSCLLHKVWHPEEKLPLCEVFRIDTEMSLLAWEKRIWIRWHDLAKLTPTLNYQENSWQYRSLVATPRQDKRNGSCVLPGRHVCAGIGSDGVSATSVKHFPVLHSSKTPVNETPESSSVHVIT